jgi:hypothetical protein
MPRAHVTHEEVRRCKQCDEPNKSPCHDSKGQDEGDQDRGRGDHQEHQKQPRAEEEQNGRAEERGRDRVGRRDVVLMPDICNSSRVMATSRSAMR